jgi:hypothetical protein
MRAAIQAAGETSKLGNENDLEIVDLEAGSPVAGESTGLDEQKVPKETRKEMTEEEIAARDARKAKQAKRTTKVVEKKEFVEKVEF